MPNFVKFNFAGQYEPLLRDCDGKFADALFCYLNEYGVDVYLTGEVIENSLSKVNKPYYHVDMVAVGENSNLEKIAEDLIGRWGENISVEETTKHNKSSFKDFLVDKQFEIINKRLIYSIEGNLVVNSIYLHLVQKSNLNSKIKITNFL